MVSTSLTKYFNCHSTIRIMDQEVSIFLNDKTIYAVSFDLCFLSFGWSKIWNEGNKDKCVPLS
jgi:hypothetical protein